MGTTKEGKGSAVSGIRGMGKCRGIATAEALVALVIVVAAIALAAYSYFGVSAPTATTSTTIPTATASTTITILTGPESAYDVNASYLPAGSPTYAASAAKLTISKIAVPQSANGSILLAYSSLLKNTSAISGNDVAISVAAAVYTFDSSAHASQEYSFLYNSTKPPSINEQFQVPGTGDQSIGFAIPATSSKKTFIVFVQYKNVFIRVTTLENAGSNSTALVIGVAQKLLASVQPYAS